MEATPLRETHNAGARNVVLASMRSLREGGLLLIGLGVAALVNGSGRLGGTTVLGATALSECFITERLSTLVTSGEV